MSSEALNTLAALQTPWSGERGTRVRSPGPTMRLPALLQSTYGLPNRVHPRVLTGGIVRGPPVSMAPVSAMFSHLRITTLTMSSELGILVTDLSSATSSVTQLPCCSTRRKRVCPGTVHPVHIACAKTALANLKEL